VNSNNNGHSFTKNVAIFNIGRSKYRFFFLNRNTNVLLTRNIFPNIFSIRRIKLIEKLNNLNKRNELLGVFRRIVQKNNPLNLIVRLILSSSMLTIIIVTIQIYIYEKIYRAIVA